MAPSEKLDRLARRSGLAPLVVAGSGFAHLIYRTPAAPQRDELLFVYLEGDGRPGTSDGSRPSSDPTTGHPLALQLMTSTSRAAIYLTRPCYNGRHREAGCSSAMWTSQRYSDAVVASLCAALERYLAGNSEVGVVLVGYSGGGTLAMLMAPRLRNVRGVITVAANLDIDAWTRLHDYESLSGSLNPAALAPAQVSAVHYVGERDTNVPPAMLAPYFTAHPTATVLRMSQFDHRCCWVEQWPRLLDTALAELKISRTVGPIPAVP